VYSRHRREPQGRGGSYTRIQSGGNTYARAKNNQLRELSDLETREPQARSRATPGRAAPREVSELEARGSPNIRINQDWYTHSNVDAIRELSDLEARGGPNFMRINSKGDMYANAHVKEYRELNELEAREPQGRGGSYTRIQSGGNTYARAKNNQLRELSELEARAKAKPASLQIFGNNVPYSTATINSYRELDELD